MSVSAVRTGSARFSSTICFLGPHGPLSSGASSTTPACQSGCRLSAVCEQKAGRRLPLEGVTSACGQVSRSER